ARKIACPSYFAQQTSLTAALAKMNAQRDLVKDKLDEALLAVEECKASIEALIVANDALASKIARAQILLADKIEREVASRTAYTGI
ncbi:MAG: hypothetical protein HUK22_01945, partial [Thermoguttaceae bacterium]|nr:hypothetical protein [Thermoguttaceae bacterium]